MQRNRYGRFQKGNKGGPGRPRKSRVESEQLHAIAIEPPDGADSCAWCEYIRTGRWFAAERGGGLLEVQKEDPMRIAWIQFRVELCEDGRKRLEIVGERVEYDGVAEYYAGIVRNAHGDDEA